MNINWYPGHMHKARKEIVRNLKNIDILIEIVDARLPYSSQNPIIRGLRRNKPSIIVLNKSDLADPFLTEQWKAYYMDCNHTTTLVCHQRDPRKIRQIFKLCQHLLPEKKTSFKPINAMILGIPNVGKSSIINTLVGRVIAKVGNEPAVTKQQQRVNLSHNIILHDTPGILWPKIENTHSGYRLAISGAIKNTAMQYDDVGFYATEYFLTYYPSLLKRRYQFTYLPSNPLRFLEEMGHKRGARKTGNNINLHKACEVLLHEFRSGDIGNITLENPDMIKKELEKINKE